MKKIFKKALVLLILTVLAFGSINVYAAENTNDWISKKLTDYEPFIKMFKENPDAKMIQNGTEYLLTETLKDEKGNILEVNQNTFTSMSDMLNHEKQIKQKDMIRLYSIGDEEVKYKTYTKMKVVLTLYKYNSNRFFVAFLYEWLTLPDYDILTYYKAVVGLALGSGLSMDGSSYSGRMTKITPGGITTKNTINGEIDVRATGTQGIAFKIHETNQDGVILDMDGVISCDAYKTSSDIIYCSAYGEYADVHLTLNLDNFSISIPAGISFGPGTRKTSYSYQDSLYLN